MRLILTVISLLLLLTACAQSSKPNFSAMSEEELAFYNASVPYHERVICQDKTEIGSIIRRRVCVSMEEDYENKRNDMEILRTVNSGPVSVDLR